MNVYGLDISFHQGLKMLAELLKVDARVIELVYLIRSERQGIAAAELLQQELEYIDSQIILCLATDKAFPTRAKCFQIERKGQRLRL